MRHANAGGLLDDVLKNTIPMHARMIHGRSKNGTLYEESQFYDAHGRVRFHDTSNKFCKFNSQ